MNKKTSIIITLVILAVVVVALGVWACTRTSQPQAAAVKTTALEKTNLQRKMCIRDRPGTCWAAAGL